MFSASEREFLAKTLFRSRLNEKIVYGNGNYLDRIRPLVISVSDLLLNEFSPF